MDEKVNYQQTINQSGLIAVLKGKPKMDQFTIHKKTGSVIFSNFCLYNLLLLKKNISTGALLY